MILSSAEKENRTITGSFYTPRIWVKKAQEYLKSALGETGRMNPKSKDERYTELLADLNAAQKALAAKIEPKIYEYGFLLD